MSADEPTYDFSVIVPAGIQTRLPSGALILLSGTTGNHEVRGMNTKDGPVVEVVGYQNSGGIGDLVMRQGAPLGVKWRAP